MSRPAARRIIGTPLPAGLRRAGTIVDAVHPDDVVAQWRQSYQQRFQPQSPPAENTLQLWAVVNRLDLETPELHIVYGPPDPSINFRMILEFVLSTDGLPTLAGQWKHLSDFDLHSTQFSGALKSLLSSLQFVSARIRTNSNLGGAVASWSLAQWDFVLGEGSYRGRALNRSDPGKLQQFTSSGPVGSLRELSGCVERLSGSTTRDCRRIRIRSITRSNIPIC